MSATDTFYDVKHRVGDSFRGMVNMFTPTPTQSHFLDKGVLTPEEFIEAGDQLVFKFPTWQWSSAPKERRVAFLPEDKQYLLTKNVPCTARVHDLDQTTAARIIDDAEGGWLLPGDDAMPGADEDAIMRIDDAEPSAPEPTLGLFDVKENFIGGEAPASTPVPDITNLLGDMEESDPAAASPGYFVAEAADAEIVRTRTHDLSITYDKYYQTPRLWLFGYDENAVPLVPEQIYEDVMSEYIARTVTVDTHPHTALPTTSIHPCKHAQVMKKVVDDWIEQGLQPRHDLALFVFLKFISGVVPTINYDFTMDIEL